MAIFGRNFLLMYIDEIYQTVQGLLKKEQNGYLKPLDFNLFATNAQYKIYDSLFSDYKTEVRKMNWALDGKDFANRSEHVRQLLEHFSALLNITAPTIPLSPVPLEELVFTLPSDIDFVEDVFVEGTTKRIDKVHFSDLRDLEGNIYASPKDCSPMCSKIGNRLTVRPITISGISLHYLRKPKTPKWTFTTYNGRALFNPSASDFQDIDLPTSFYDRLVNEISIMAGISIRDGLPIQSLQQEKAFELQQDKQE